MRRSLLPLTALLVVLVLAVRRILFVVRVDGVSMEPAFRSGDTVLALRMPFGLPVHRGDVVVCRLPVELQGPTGYIVKRAAGLAGDEVPTAGTIPAGRLYLLGDGPHSYDSRRFGPLPMSAVRGRVIARLRTARTG